MSHERWTGGMRPRFVIARDTDVGRPVVNENGGAAQRTPPFFGAMGIQR